MPNVHSPSGARPVMHRNGSPYHGQFRTYAARADYNTALRIGDFVVMQGTSSTINGRVLLNIENAAASSVLTGAIVGFKPDTQDSLRYRAASTLREVYVADDPDLIFEMQEGNSGTALAADDAGLNIDFVVATGSDATGLSGNQLNNATEATSNTVALRLIAPVAREDNEIGYSCKWLVSINRHSFANQIAGV